MFDEMVYLLFLCYHRAIFQKMFWRWEKPSLIPYFVEHNSPNGFVKNAECIRLTKRCTIFKAKNQGRPWWLPIRIWWIWLFWRVEVQISFLDFIPEESMIEDKNLSSEVQIWFLEFVTKQERSFYSWWATWFIKFYLWYLFKEMFTYGKDFTVSKFRFDFWISWGRQT